MRIGATLPPVTIDVFINAGLHLFGRETYEEDLFAVLYWCRPASVSC